MPQYHIPQFFRNKARLLLFCVCFAYMFPVLADDPDLVYSTEELPAEFTSQEDSLHTIVFTGDIMPWDRTKNLILQHGSKYPYIGVLPILKKADITVGNLEGPVAINAQITKGTFRYKIPPHNVEAMREAGFDLMSLSNNHAMDCGTEGLQETMFFLHKSGIRSFGAGYNLQTAAMPAVSPLGKHRIAFVAAICPETFYFEHENSLEKGAYSRMSRLMHSRLGASKERGGLVIATTESIQQMVREANEVADFVVAFLHFGIRYHRPPSEQQQRLAYAAIDAGADLVVGHHSHIWQPAGLYRNVPIVYGLGNFAFGSANRRANEGMLLRVTFDKEGIALLEFFPLNTKNRDPSVNYQSKIMEEEAARKTCQTFNTMSAQYGANLTWHKGRSCWNFRPQAGYP